MGVVTSTKEAEAKACSRLLRQHGDVETATYHRLMEISGNWNTSEPLQHDWAQYVLSQARAERIVANVLGHFGMPAHKREKALDVGCGFGSLVAVLQKHFSRAYGLDILDGCLEWARRRAADAEFVCGSATELPWDEATFDLVLCTDVFEHLPFGEQHVAAKELWRVLRPLGHGYVEVPNRYQIMDEHHRVLFGTWLPDAIRRRYVRAASQRAYIACWERTGQRWKRLFESQGFQVTIVPRYARGMSTLKYFLLPPNRFHLYLTKAS